MTAEGMLRPKGYPMGGIDEGTAEGGKDGNKLEPGRGMTRTLSLATPFVRRRVILDLVRC